MLPSKDNIIGLVLISSTIGCNNVSILSKDWVLIKYGKI